MTSAPGDEHLAALASRTAFYGPRLRPASLASGVGAVPVPVTAIGDLVAERLRSGCPYSGRHVPVNPPTATLQLDYAVEAQLYVGLGQADFYGYVSALEHALSLAGLRSGSTLAVYDYGSSPVVYLASGLYMPGLGIGAADRLGCAVICNDGGANLAQRAVEILEYVRPQILVLRDDCVGPFVAACAAANIDVSRHIEALLVTRNDGEIARSWVATVARRLGVRVSRLPRSDAAMFIALECATCGLLHVPRDLYSVEITDAETALSTAPAGGGRLVVTNRSARDMLSLRLLTSLRGSLPDESCVRGANDVLVSLV